ncbi:MAG: hypothetical protein H6767_06225 [Candidatus Peribacteria bacterium]|nr:MAG: hypothetical protein H6767_06225 [Candidatus Peribacteria bacterium]
MIYSIIGRNYIRIDTGNTEQDKQDNLTMAIEVSANEVLQDFKNIPKDKQTFKNAMLDIASSNMQRKIEGLTTLYLLAAGAAGIRGQAMEGSKRLLQKGIEFKKQKLMERFEALQIQLMKAEEDIDVDNAFLTKLHDDIARVRAEAWEIENGEVFG